MKTQILLSVIYIVAVISEPFLGDAIPNHTTNLPSKVRRSIGEVVTGAIATSVNYKDGSGSGTDAYKTYNGDGAAGFPAITEWVNFSDMWNANTPAMLTSCANLGYDINNSEDDIGNIWHAIDTVAAKAQLDHRFILAVIMQESSGCVFVKTTHSAVPNPGLMQCYDGTASCYGDTSCSKDTILQRVTEGSMGTYGGNGLAAGINEAQSQYGVTGAQAYYYAARLYNSGEIVNTNNLGTVNTNGRLPCYVSDIANRLVGWVDAEKTCNL